MRKFNICCLKILLLLQTFLFIPKTVIAEELALYNNENLNVTTHLEDYIILNKRQYAAIITGFESELAAFRENYLARIKAIDIQYELVESKILWAENKLNPLEILDTFSKHCVQKYRSKLTTVASVKAAIATCTYNGGLGTLLSGTENVVKSLSNYYNINLNNLLNDCKKKFPNQEQFNYTFCVTQAIQTVNLVTTQNQKNFLTAFNGAKCSAEARINAALECSFVAQFNTISIIGETMRLIENCIAGLELCPVQPGAGCNNVIDLPISEIKSPNATIPNIYKDFNDTLSCLQINFYK